MANKKKPLNEIKRPRMVALSDKQVNYIKTKLHCGLTSAFEKLIEILKTQSSKNDI